MLAQVWRASVRNRSGDQKLASCLVRFWTHGAVWNLIPEANQLQEDHTPLLDIGAPSYLPWLLTVSHSFI